MTTFVWPFVKVFDVETLLVAHFVLHVVGVAGLRQSHQNFEHPWQLASSRCLRTAVAAPRTTGPRLQAPRRREDTRCP